MRGKIILRDNLTRIFQNREATIAVHSLVICRLQVFNNCSANRLQIRRIPIDQVFWRLINRSYNSRL